MSTVKLYAVLFLVVLNSCFERNNEAGKDVPDFFLSKKQPEQADTISLDTLFTIFPWSEWNLNLYRPQSAVKIVYKNAVGEDTKLVLVEFDNDYLPFGLLKRYIPKLLDNGSYFSGSHLVFKNGRYLGVIYLNDNEVWNEIKSMEYGSFFDKKTVLPKVFDSFPIKGRIVGSETVIPHHYLGMDNLGEAVGMDFQCYFDTAHVFRTFFNPHQKIFSSLINNYQGKVDTLDNGSILTFWGVSDFNNPIYVLGYRNGLISCEGCSDHKISMEITKKTQKLDVLLK